MLPKKQQLISKNNFRLLPVDIVVLAYMFITALYMLYGINRLHNSLPHFLIRVGFSAVILLFGYYDGKPVARKKGYNFIRNFYPLIILSFFYKETGYLNNIIFDYFDPWFVKTEQALWGMQPSVEFSKHYPQKWFSELMNFGYFFYYLITVGLSVIAYLWNPRKFQKIVFIIVASFIIYYLIFAFFPVKGPQFYFSGNESQPVDSYLFSKLVKAAQYLGEAETGAFPSSHVGMSVIFLILSFKYLRRAFWIILIPVILLWFATVYIKAHYLIDVIGGFISAPLIYSVSVYLYAAIRNRQQRVFNK